MYGWIKEDIFDLFPQSFFEDPVFFVKHYGGEIIKDSRYRWAGIFLLRTNQKIFLKRDKTKGWLEALKYSFLPSKGRKEWFIAYQLQKKGLPIPKPLGWMEKIHRGWVKESYYMSEAIGSGVSLIELVTNKIDIPIESLAKTVRLFHDTGLFHKDLHGGNFIWNGKSFFLTDLHRSKIRSSVSNNERLWNLAQLFYSLRSMWEEKDFLLFLKKYFSPWGLDSQKEKEVFEKIQALMFSLQRRQFKSRTKRCLKESTEFSKQKEGKIRYYHRRDFSLDLLRKNIERHQKISREKTEDLIKDESGVTISMVEEGEKKIVVKEFHPLTLWDRLKELFRRSKSMKAWINGNGIIVRGVTALNPLGLAEERRGLGLKRSFFLMEALEGGEELDRYLFNGFQDMLEKRAFIKTFAQWIAYLHKMGIYHRDMKACNILVSINKTSWDFYLLDLEDIRLDRRVNIRELFRNFLQLNTSIPRTITHTDRLRFLKNYFRSNPGFQYDKRWIFRLLHETKRRGVVYVTPSGVVKERWA
jgi:tRNA A-37 threonylcarbamoyl transferase component Bud32